MNIDIRARRAADDLHAAVARHRQLTHSAPLHPNARPPRRRTPAVAVIAILIAGVVAGIAVLGRDPARKVSSTRNELPLLLPAWLPDGVRAVSIGDPRREPDDTASADAWYLGSAAGPRMVLQRTAAPGRFSPDDRDAVRIAGEPGAFVVAAVGGRSTRALVWNKDGAMLALTTFEASRGELEQVAAAVQSATAPLEDIELPDGSRVLGHDRGGRWLERGVGQSGRTVGWAMPGGRGEFVSVNVRRVSGDLRVARAFWGGTTTTIRGREAWFVPGVDGEPLEALTWLESPGIAVTVSSNYLDASSVARVADSLTTATLEQWDAVADEVRRGAAPPQMRGADYDVLLTGRSPSGTTWEIARRLVSPFLYCILIDHQGDTFTGAVSCSGRIGAHTVFADRSGRHTGRSGEQIQLVYGMVEAGVARVVVETTDDVVEATLGEPRDGFRPFAAPVVLSTRRVRTYDAAGNALGDVPSVEPGAR